MKTNAGGDRVLKGHDKLKFGLVRITKPVTHSLIAFFHQTTQGQKSLL